MIVDPEILRQSLNNGTINFEENTQTIGVGELNQNGKLVPYEIKHGWNPAIANQCDNQWAIFYTTLFEHIESLNKSPSEEQKILSSIQIGDIHWNWFDKTLHYKEDKYEWFFLTAEGNPQGVCLFFHPERAKLEEGEIFYIEYLAVSPWNRSSLVNKQQFKGIGTILLNCSIRFAIGNLKLKPGFSLHSLKQAEGYYLKIGMERIPEEDKKNLCFFEMNEESSKKMVGIS